MDFRDKFEPPIANYITEEDVKQWDDINARFEPEVYNNMTEEEQLEIDGELDDVENKVFIRYINACNNDATIILQDIYNRIDNVSIEEFENYLNGIKASYERLKNYEESIKNTDAYKEELEKPFNYKEYMESLERRSVNSINSFYDYSLNIVYPLYRALELWNVLKLDPPAKAPFDIDENPKHISKIKDWRPIDENIKKCIFKTYYILYPDATEKPDDATAIRAHQAIIHYRSVDTLDYPVDKPNSELWRVINTAQSGQLSFAFETGKAGENTATVLCSVDWDDPNTKITKHLTEWDKRVYIATASLFDGGNDTVTLNQIHKLMGNDSNASDKQLDKINDSLTKMGTARLYIDNHEEIEANYNYPQFQYDAPLLPFKRITATSPIDRKKITAIRITEEPPLIAFARGRKQITTIPLGLLKSPVSKTEDNLRLEDYLIERISHMKTKRNLSRKILFTKLCEKCNLTTKKQKQRITTKIIRYLDHYKTNNFIIDYEIDDDKDITIII